MTFGEKLQKLRRESGLSQEKLAEQLNVSRQAVSRWELGTAAPDVDTIVRLSKFFQVSIEYLILEECQDPSGSRTAPPPSTPEEKAEAEKKHKGVRQLPLWFWLAAGVALEFLSYGLCYPMQEREMRMYGEWFTYVHEYMFRMPLIWLTLAGAACVVIAAVIWWKRKWDNL